MKLIQFRSGKAKSDQIIIEHWLFISTGRGQGGKNLGDQWSEYPVPGQVTQKEVKWGKDGKLFTGVSGDTWDLWEW